MSHPILTAISTTSGLIADLTAIVFEYAYSPLARHALSNEGAYHYEYPADKHPRYGCSWTSQNYQHDLAHYTIRAPDGLTWHEFEPRHDNGRLFTLVVPAGGWRDVRYSETNLVGVSFRVCGDDGRLISAVVVAEDWAPVRAVTRETTEHNTMITSPAGLRRIRLYAPGEQALVCTHWESVLRHPPINGVRAEMTDATFDEKHKQLTLQVCDDNERLVFERVELTKQKIQRQNSTHAWWCINSQISSDVDSFHDERPPSLFIRQNIPAVFGMEAFDVIGILLRCARVDGVLVSTQLKCKVATPDCEAVSTLVIRFAGEWVVHVAPRGFVFDSFEIVCTDNDAQLTDLMLIRRHSN